MDVRAREARAILAARTLRRGHRSRALGDPLSPKRLPQLVHDYVNAAEVGKTMSCVAARVRDLDARRRRAKR
jgi:hypothetical protein